MVKVAVVVTSLCGCRRIHGDKDYFRIKGGNLADAVRDLQIVGVPQRVFNSGFGRSECLVTDLLDVRRVLVDAQHGVARPLQIQRQAKSDFPYSDNRDFLQDQPPEEALWLRILAGSADGGENTNSSNSKSEKPQVEGFRLKGCFFSKACSATSWIRL